MIELFYLFDGKRYINILPINHYWLTIGHQRKLKVNHLSMAMIKSLRVCLALEK